MAIIPVVINQRVVTLKNYPGITGAGVVEQIYSKYPTLVTELSLERKFLLSPSLVQIWPHQYVDMDEVRKGGCLYFTDGGSLKRLDSTPKVPPGKERESIP